MSVRALSRHFSLGLDDWYPDHIPGPDHDGIIIEGTGKNRRDVLREAILGSYDVMTDDAALRSRPGSFEELRGNYPVRREPGSHIIRILDDTAGSGKLLEDLGFQVLSDQCC